MADPGPEGPQDAPAPHRSPYGAPVAGYQPPHAGYQQFQSGPQSGPQPGYEAGYQSGYQAYGPAAPPAPPVPAPPSQPPSQPPFESRRARRRRESGEVPVLVDAPPVQPPAQLPVRPQDGPPPQLPVRPPDGPPFRPPAPLPGMGTDDLDALDGGRRSTGRRVSETSELNGIRKIAHLTWLPGLAALLLAWSLTTLVGDVRWGALSVVPAAFACLSPLLVVPALPVIAMAVRRRSWAALVPALAAVALPWIFAVGYVLPAPPVKGETVPLRAVLVTAHNGVADAEDIAAAVRSQRADLLVVTELSARLTHDLTQTGLARSLSPRYVAVPEEGASPASGLGIYSRFEVDDVRPLTGTHWPAVRARVMVGTTAVTLVAGHAVQPSTGHLDRWRQDLRAFGGTARIKGPVLVLASLNATPWMPQFRAITSGRLHDAADVFGQGLRPTWPDFSPVPIMPTDHALVAGAGVTSLTTATVGRTDHRALAVELSVPRAPPP